MFGNKISVIYFYFISAVSIGFVIIGLFYISSLVINSTQFEKYPLRYGLENCENPYFINPKGPYPASIPEVASPSATEIAYQKDQCLKNTEFERKQHKLDDIKNSVMFTLIGIVLFGIHFPLARKQSKP